MDDNRALAGLLMVAINMRELLVDECCSRDDMGFDVLNDDQISLNYHCKPTITVAEIREFCAAVDAVHPPDTSDED